jgi:hypothetical protein
MFNKQFFGGNAHMHLNIYIHEFIINVFALKNCSIQFTNTNNKTHTPPYCKLHIVNCLSKNVFWVFLNSYIDSQLMVTSEEFIVPVQMIFDDFVSANIKLIT